MKGLFFTLLLAASCSAFGQTTVTLTEDLVLDDTYVFTENTTIIGNGYKIICEGCRPMIYVKNGAMVDFQNVVFARGYNSFIRVDGGSAAGAQWTSPRMEGSINWNPAPPVQ